MHDMQKDGEWLVSRLRDGDANQPLGNLLREDWSLPRKQVHLLFQHKEILLDGSPVAQHAHGEAGQELRLRICQPEPFGVEPADDPLDVRYEDDHLLVACKPAGILLHPTEKHHLHSLDHLVAGHFNRTGVKSKVRHVHRLDQDTSGLVLYAKHAWAAAMLDELLRERQIKRTYLAFVHGSVRSARGTINEPIGRDRNHATRRRVTPNGDAAITHYKVLTRYDGVTLIECSLETGRTHQIRVHLSHIGHPLLGDSLYGGRNLYISRQALHAARLHFPHPFGGHKITVEAALPPDLQALQNKLREVPI